MIITHVRYSSHRVGLGVLGGGLAFYFDGISIQSQVRDDEQIEARYRRDLQWSKIMYGASAVPLVAGGTLMVWPSPSGAAIGWSTTF